MSASTESFVGWIKRHHVSLESGPDAGRVVNLSTSGVHTPTIDGWFERICRERLPDLIAQMTPRNEFGLPALKEAIRQTYRVPDDRDVYLAAGASAAYRLVCESLFAGRTGVEVLIESPTYQPLAILPPRFGAKVVPVPIPLKRAAGDVVAAFARAVRPSTSAVVLANLHNPTGNFLTRDEMGHLAREVTAVAPQATVIVDETFLGLGPEPFRTAADLNPCIIAVSSLTKTFGLGHLRSGWVIADKARYPQLLDDWIQFESIGSKILEALSVLAFEEIDSLLQQSREHLAKNSSLLIGGIQDLKQQGLIEGDVPQSGCLFFPRWTGRTDSNLIANRLQHEFRVLISPGRFFGDACKDHVRIGFGGSSNDVRQGLERLTRGLQALA